MKMKALIPAVLAAIACLVPACAYSADNIWCKFPDAVHSTVYYSEVFAFSGSGVEYTHISTAFSNHVHANYDGAVGTASCFSSSDKPTARSKQDEDKATERESLKQKVVSTGWTY